MIRASELNSGKPTTTPRATTVSRRHWPRLGRGAWVHRRYAQASGAAPTDRPKATNHGSRCCTATRVAGRDRLKASTPNVPSASPFRRPAVTVPEAVALL
ncbi:hypothetical protein GCM10027605_71060 [Micromonospora zhanjiangensis]